MDLLNRYRGALGAYLSDEFFENQSFIHKAFIYLLEYLGDEVLDNSTLRDNALNPLTADERLIPNFYKDIKFPLNFRREFSSPLQERMFLFLLIQLKNANPQQDVIKRMLVAAGLVASEVDVVFTKYNVTYYAFANEIKADYTQVPNMTNTSSSNYNDMFRYNNDNVFYTITLNWLNGDARYNFANAIISYLTMIKYNLV